MLAENSGVVQGGILEDLPTSLPDSTSSAFHPLLVLFCVAATCVCLIITLFKISRWGRGREEGPLKEVPSTRVKSPIIEGPGEYIRPLGNLEAYMAVGGKYGTLNTIQTLWLASKEPINPSEVYKAIFHVMQKTQTLQVCVEWWGLTPWFRQMKELKLDFKIEEDEVTAVIYNQVHKPYDMKKGPLWRARLVPIHTQSSSDSYQAALIVSAHHSITDGHTNMQICRDIMELLNASLTGRVYEVPLRPVIPSVSDSLMPKSDLYYLFKYSWSKIYSSLIKDFSSKLYFQGALKQPRTKTAQTKFLRETFTVEETKELFRHCKENGVKMNSCVMATASLALLQTAQQSAEHMVDAAQINSINSVDMRRYFPDKFKDASGCHISVSEAQVLIPASAANSKDLFWSLVKTFQNNLNNSLNVEYTPIRVSRLVKLYSIHIPLNYELTRRGLKNRTDNHISSTNMGNLKTLLPAKYDGPVEITDFFRSSTGEFGGHPFTLVFHTFDDRFTVSIDYYTNKLTDAGAELYFSNLTRCISNIAHMGTVQEPVLSHKG